MPIMQDGILMPITICDHPKILIVDDDPDNHSAIGFHLGMYGLKYDSAFNGQLGIDMVKKKEADQKCNCIYKLIIMDCNMPLMNGYTACNILKNLMKKGKLKKAFIVAYTGEDSLENVKKCKRF